MLAYLAVTKVYGLTFRERLDVYGILAWFCGLRGHDWPNWSCETCPDYENVGMTCPHERLFRFCGRCGLVEFTSVELPKCSGAGPCGCK